jgi:RES domain-containing protein
MAPERTIRQPPTQADFDRIEVPALDVEPWANGFFRLANTGHKSQFFASPGSRLTPFSRAFPCVYLAQDKETAVAEIWGDRFFAQRATGAKVFSIAESEAEKLRFLQVEKVPALKLCDLTDAATLLSVGIDAATLYCPNLEVPQNWADLIARHPAAFDGILYESRHTNTNCIVAWNSPACLLEHKFTFADAGPFLMSPESYAVAKLAGVMLAFTR